MPGTNVLDIPGYQEALVQEQVAREVSFLPITETVAGFELVPMTFRQFLILGLMKHPFLIGQTPGPTDLAQFLWLLNPHYKPNGGWHKWRMMRRLHRCFPPVEPIWSFKWLQAKRRRRVNLAVYRLMKLVQAIRKYVSETLQDWQPSGVPTGSVQVAHYSDGAAICATIAREYGWPQETTLNMPMKQLLQYLKEIKVFNGSKLPMVNPSDTVKAKWLETVNNEAEASKILGDRGFVTMPGGNNR